MAGAVGDGGQDRGGHGEHQGTGAEYDQQCHGTVEGRIFGAQRRASQEQLQAEEGGRGGQGEDGVGVAPAVDGTLSGGLALLCLADESHNAVEGAILFGLGHADDEPTPAVECTAGDACPRPFLHGLGFAG